MTTNHSSEHDDGQHGHSHDRGLRGMLGYLRFARDMWQSEINDAVVARLAPQPGETVMDIGAGAGAGAMVAARTGAKVVAVEPMSYMRGVLKFRRFVGRLHDRVTIVDGAAEALGVGDGSIDAAMAANTMHHWTSLEAGIAEMARVLAPGGRVLLVDEDFDDLDHPEYGKFGAKRQEEHAHHFATIDADTIASELRKAGLTVHFAGMARMADRPVIVIDGSL